LLSYKWSLNIIIKEIKIFSQNIHKNNLLTSTILEAQEDFNIIFIQEPSWSIIHSISSSSNKEGKNLVDIPNHSNWMIIFFKNPLNIHKVPRVITYINIRLSSFHFSLWKNILIIGIFLAFYFSIAGQFTFW